MERIANAWELAKASWRVLSKDRELIAVPLVAGLAALVAFVGIAAPGLLMANSDAETTSNIATWIFVVLGVVAATWVTALGEATVVAGSAQRMEGGDPTVGSAFATARARTFRLLQWALLATVVAVVLDQIEERLGAVGRIVSWIGGVAFRVMSFLALPVVVFENVGAVEAFKRSSALLKRTWGEQVSFNFGMGLLGLVAALPGIIVGGGLLGTGILPLQIVGGLVLGLWVALVWATVTALSAVFKTALYRYANGLPVDPAFEAASLERAFRQR